ncbi:methyltransferase [Mucilaginibacter gynuensis]|uniref:tRNA1(Val) (adenine(37)-N6)-methyltransferase n=1 Tax=Mucilaginibacter gynuensis TaxID=1302236 RepID=A0ABP8FTW1_9SPHI
MIFKFKQFNVDQSGCAMKINTDGVLIGAMATGKAGRVLDIGTGTGVIALMLAQRFNEARIDAVEIDGDAAATAKKNFEGSPFANRLNLFPGDFEDFFKSNPQQKFDLIVSNPPFYIDSLASPGEKKNLAKHADASFFERLLAHVADHLSDDGAFWLILPLQTAALVKALAAENKLHLQEQINIRSFAEDTPHRQIIVLSKSTQVFIEKDFIIYSEPKQYTTEYQHLLKDFFTIF